MATERSGQTLISPEVKPLAPTAQSGGAQGSARPPTQTMSGGQRRIASARRKGVGEAHFTPTTPGTLQSFSMASKPMVSLRR